MKKILLLFAFSLLLISNQTFAGPGDTTFVQTFTFGSAQNGWFQFPSAATQWEKILMRYKLKCNPAQNPACGEWDYLTYTYLYQPGFDSVPLTAHNYMVNATWPDSFSYLTSPAYQLHPYWQYFIVNTDTVSLSTSTVGSGISTTNNPLGLSQPVSRTQYVWRAAELSAAGLLAGNFTGLQFNFQSASTEIKHLTIRMKATALDSVTAGNYETSGFTQVYSFNTTVLNSGWNSFAFTSPFNWDGVSNVLVEITYDNDAAATDVPLFSDSTIFPSGINSSGNDGSMHFNDANYISVPPAAFASVDSAITVSFWFKGDPFLEDRTAFEASDQYNNRVLNVHLPWSDGNVYWDAGGDGLLSSFDRISKSANVTDYENEWHNWAFVKNASTGMMKIYKDGVLWHSGTNLNHTIPAIKTFWIGTALWSNTVSANGSIDEFTVWNTELDQTAIQDYLYKDVDASHPYISNLLVYYKFNEGNYLSIHDYSGNGFDGTVVGAQPQVIPASTLFRNFLPTATRPQITFEQGVFNSYIDSQIVWDTMWIDPITLTLYQDVNNPGVATDSQLVWLPYYQYVFDANGNIIDSVYIAADQTLYLTTSTYNVWSATLKRFELARYITPYGINLSLGNGWTWTYDLSDYAPLLHDSVYLTAGNWQELLDVQFVMIEGTPPRNPISVTNIWNGDIGYGTTTETQLPAKDIAIPANAVNTRFKLRITGHGEDNNNCAEFCQKNCYLKIDGNTQYQKLIWRPTCPLNPLYPQGGTWVYERANWCPGAEVETYDWELTPYVTPGTTANLDLDMQPYSGSGGANYVTESQLITYGAPNFSLDAAIDEIITPSNYDLYSRMNPICNNPHIRIKNTGSTPLTSLQINYGIENGTQQVYQWAGNLNFLETADVDLGTIFAPASGNSNKFTVTVSNPNGGADEYAYNNTATSYFSYPPQFPSPVVVECKTNNNSNETNYVLTDDQGNVILNRDNLSDNVVYHDTLALASGCYIFHLYDSGEDGLSFWANSAQGSGYIRFRNPVTGSYVKSYNGDFGEEVFQEFTVGYYLDVPEQPQTDYSFMNVYPNPNDGTCMIDILLNMNKDVALSIVDLSGKVVWKNFYRNVLSQAITVDLTNEPPGIYLAVMKTADEVETKKIIVGK